MVDFCHIAMRASHTEHIQYILEPSFVITDSVRGDMAMYFVHMITISYGILFHMCIVFLANQCLDMNK